MGYCDYCDKEIKNYKINKDLFGCRGCKCIKYPCDCVYCDYFTICPLMKEYIPIEKEEE
jgi:hypothetical protein